MVVDKHWQESVEYLHWFLSLIFEHDFLPYGIDMLLFNLCRIAFCTKSILFLPTLYFQIGVCGQLHDQQWRENGI